VNLPTPRICRESGAGRQATDLDSNAVSPIASIAPNDHLEEFARFVRASTANSSSSAEPQTLKAWLDLAEAYRITEALKECRGNRSAAARLLGIGRRTLYAKMDKLGINPTWRVGI